MEKVKVSHNHHSNSLVMHEHKCNDHGCSSNRTEMMWADIRNSTIPQINSIESNIFLNEVKTVEDYISYLSNRDCSPLNKDDQGYTHAHYAIMTGNIEILEYLITNYNCDIHSIIDNSMQESTIHLSIDSGNVNMTHFLISKGVDPNLRNINGQNAFIYSCFKNRILHASYLARLQHININSADNDGCTGLHYAVMNKSEKLVNELLNYDIDLKKSDKDGMTPLHVASRNGYASISMKILEKDITTFSCIDSMNKFPLDYALQGKCPNTQNVFTHFDQLRRLPKIVREYRTYIPILIWSIAAFIAVLYVPLIIKLLIYVGFIITFTILVNKVNILHTKDSTIKAVVISIGVMALLYSNYAAYISPAPAPLKLLFICNLSTILSICILIKVSNENPGFILKNPRDIIALYNDIDQIESLNSYYCPTCISIRPERSKHCSLCECCVLRMDHHCPWINNCVGEKNHALFYVFIILSSISAILIFSVLMYCIFNNPSITGAEGLFNKFLVMNKEIPTIIEFLLLDIFFGAFTSYMTGLHTYFIAKNITTFEFVYWKRYKYMKDEEGNYYNRYDQGAYNNFKNEFRSLFNSESNSIYKVV